MSSASSAPSLSGLARLLVQAGQIDEDRARELFAQAERKRTTFISEVINAQAYTSPRDLANFLATTLHLPLLDLEGIDPKRLPLKEVDEALVQRYKMLPLSKRRGKLYIAAADPTQEEIIKRVQFATRLSTEWVVVECDKLMQLREELEISSSGDGAGGSDAGDWGDEFGDLGL